MKITKKEIISALPVHDSEFLGIEILQKNNGETDLILNIAFCKGEFEDLTEYSTVISTEGQTSFLFTKCEWIRINTVCNRTQRDSIDFFDFKLDSLELVKHNAQKDKVHVEVVLVSGSKIECVVKSIELCCLRV